MTPTEVRIVEAALGLIAQHGLGGVSMTGVAGAAGVSRQTLYNHFPGVEEIVTAILEQHQGESLDRLDALLATEDRASGRLELLIRHQAAVVGHPGHGPELARALSAGAREILLQYEASLTDRIVGILADGIACGEFRGDLDPGRDAVLLLRMLDGLADLARSVPDDRAAAVTGALQMVHGAVVA